MNIYRKKQWWKIILVLIAIILVAISLWYSNTIVKKVAQKEKDRVEQWADAVKRKADLVNLTNSAFEELRENERKKVEFWTLSMEEINKDLDDYSYVLNILKMSSTVPMILTDKNNKIVSTHNLAYIDTLIKKDLENEATLNKDSLFKIKKADTLNYFIENWSATHSPLSIDLYKGEKQKVYYFDSKKVEDLAKSKDSLFDAFTNELITNEYLVPVLFLNRDTRELIATNIPKEDTLQTEFKLEDYSFLQDSILIDLGNDKKGVIYFEHSQELTQLRYFPLIQFFIVGLFIMIGYLVFSTFRKAEQDHVWVGMAKETAHQLGTPISSLMAWIQLLEEQNISSDIITEMNKDVERLDTVTNRFSKIGSKAILKEENIVQTIEKTTNYLKNRISNKIELNLEILDREIILPFNAPLIEWVIENITKNAVDAMSGKGKIDIKIQEHKKEVWIDIIDNGKGIPSSKLKTVFAPGYTTKERGWGLGLSLVKRIVEEFHKGKIFVLQSEINVGTTFRIILRK